MLVTIYQTCNCRQAFQGPVLVLQGSTLAKLWDFSKGCLPQVVAVLDRVLIAERDSNRVRVPEF